MLDPRHIRGRSEIGKLMIEVGLPTVPGHVVRHSGARVQELSSSCWRTATRRHANSDGYWSPKYWLQRPLAKRRLAAGRQRRRRRNEAVGRPWCWWWSIPRSRCRALVRNGTTAPGRGLHDVIITTITT